MLAALFTALLVVVAAVLPPDVRTARELRLMPVRDAQTGRSVRLTGVVTFCPPRGEYFYLQDDTGGVRVNWIADRQVETGDKVEVTGVTAAGDFLPEVTAREVKDSGAAELPKPVPFTLTTDDSAYLDGQWVEVIAVVQRAWTHDGWLQFDLARGRGDAVAYVPSPLPARIKEAEKFAGAVMRVRGVCRVNANANRRPIGPPRILVSQLSAFEEVEPPPADPFALATTPAADLALFRPDPIAARLPVRITGVVTLNLGRTQFYVRDGDAVVQAVCINSAAAKTGDRVSVVGFPRLTAEPFRLDNARLRVSGPGPLPPPQPGTPADARDGKLEGQVVRFVGSVHETERQGAWMTLTVVADGLTFTVVLLDEETAVMSAPVAPGSTVEVVGGVTRLPLSGVRRNAFAVLTRSEGVTVLEPPPTPPPPSWWTGRRVAYLLAGVCGLALLGGATVTALRVQVRRAALLARRQSEENVKLEGQLQVAAKFEAVGRVAGGVAHDFNNILTVINGCAQLLDEEIASDPRHAVTLAADIRRAGRFAAAITRLLLAFSRQRPVAPHALDLNVVVADAAPVLARLLGVGTTMRVATDPHLPPVLAETGMLLQILINLAVNAGEAMPTAGTFTIATSSVEPGWVRLTAADTGAGMTAEVRARAFNRGFSTKPSGTGLGLSTVQGIVQALGGRIRCRSEVGRGTEFEIDLPTVGVSIEAAHSPADTLPTDLPTAAAGHDETATAVPVPPQTRSVVLVVEDDDDVRAFVCHALEQAGLRVLAAGTPDEAMRVLAGHTGSVALLITDLMLPGLTGPQLAERVRAARPGVRVLFMSGYAPDDVPGASDLSAEFIHKPFLPRELTERVWRALGEPAG